jgi:DNA-binding transcriptional LysR family regulator
VAPSLDYLRTFVAVLRTGSFTAAAGLVGLSQPAVTSQMRALEGQLGYLLFDRHGRRVSPTAKAEQLGAEVARHIDRLEAATDREDRFFADRPRVLHLGGPAEYLSMRVIPLLPALAEQNLGFRVSFGLADKLLADLSQGALDIVVSSIHPRVRGVVSAPLIDEEFVLVAAPRWADRLRLDQAVAPQALVDLLLVAYGDNLAIVRRYWRTVFELPPEGLNLVATIPNLAAIADALIAGLGMSVLPRYLVAEPLRNGSLVTLLEPELAPLNTLHVATRERALSRDRAVRIVHGALLADADRAGCQLDPLSRTEPRGRDGTP